MLHAKRWDGQASDGRLRTGGVAVGCGPLLTVAVYTGTRRNSRSGYVVERLHVHEHLGCTPDLFEGMVLDSRIV